MIQSHLQKERLLEISKTDVLANKQQKKRRKFFVGLDNYLFQAAPDPEMEEIDPEMEAKIQYDL